MEFSRPEYWSGQPFPSPGDLPNPGIEPRAPALQADSLPAEPQGKTLEHVDGSKISPHVSLDWGKLPPCKREKNITLWSLIYRKTLCSNHDKTLFLVFMEKKEKVALFLSQVKGNIVG